MKRGILLLILFLASQFCFGQKFISKIDSLESAPAVEKFIHSFGRYFDQFEVKPVREFKGWFMNDVPCKKLADSLEITQTFYKSDFDQNGYKDLLAIGTVSHNFSVLVVMSYGHDSFDIKLLTRRSFQNCTFPKLINDTIIKYYYMSEPSLYEKSSAPRLVSSKLIFKFGDFVEYNPKPLKYSIEKIEYETSVCLGSCPEFSLSIAKDRSAIYRPVTYNEDASAIIDVSFSTVLTESSFSALIGLLNYIDFPHLQNSYAVNWTDDQGCELTITYNNGKVKKIKDYGLLGTFGLDRLYQLLFDLRFNQDWKKL